LPRLLTRRPNSYFDDGYANTLARAEREGDAGALNVLAHRRSSALAHDLPSFSRVLIGRATLLRQWLMFFQTYPVLVMPVSAELPFENHLECRATKRSRAYGTPPSPVDPQTG
jgi:hypothetical protein